MLSLKQTQLLTVFVEKNCKSLILYKYGKTLLSFSGKTKSWRARTSIVGLISTFPKWYQVWVLLSKLKVCVCDFFHFRIIEIDWYAVNICLLLLHCFKLCRMQMIILKLLCSVHNQSASSKFKRKFKTSPYSSIDLLKCLVFFFFKPNFWWIKSSCSTKVICSPLD